MKSFVEKASQLESERAALLNQSKETKDFLSQFHLSQHEVDLLTSAKLDIATQAKSFFSVLSKVKSAYSDCKVSRITCVFSHLTASIGSCTKPRV